MIGLPAMALIWPWRSTSSALSRAFSASTSAPSPTTASIEPISRMMAPAVFSPIPATPGTLSTASPQSACTSITLSGVTPNLSSTSSAPIQRSAGCPGRTMVSSSLIEPSGSTSCIRSLSDEAMVTLAPIFLASHA